MDRWFPWREDWDHVSIRDELLPHLYHAFSNFDIGPELALEATVVFWKFLGTGSWLELESRNLPFCGYVKLEVVSTEVVSKNGFNTSFDR